MNDILTYQELENQVALLKKENEILQLKSSFDKEEKGKGADRYRNLYDFAPSGYFTLDSEFRICELNFSGAKMLGKERSQLIDCNFTLFITADSRIAFIHFFDQILKTKSKQSCEVQMCINENPTIFVYVEGAFSEIDQKILLTVVDVNERNQGDVVLDKTKEYLQNTIDGLMESVVLLDKDGVILFTNKAWQEFAEDSGVAKEMSSVGTNYLAACKTKEGAWLQDAQPFAEKFEKLISGELRNFSIEYSSHSSSEECWFVCNASMHETKDSSYIVLAHENISKRKKAEQALEKSEKKARQNNELLRSIMESPKGMIIFSLDPQYCYTAFTVSHIEVMKQIWGVDIEVGMNILDLISEDSDRETAKQNFDLALRGESSITIEEYGRDDLKRTWWENRYSPIYSDINTIVGLTVFVSDITDCKRLDATLLDNQHRFEKSQALGHVGNWEYNIETELFWISDESKRIYGFDLDSNNFTLEEAERNIPERERVHQALSDLIADDKNYDLEFEIIPADKTPRKIIHSIAELERDLSNNPIRVRGVILDITASKKTEQALKESELRFKNIFEKHDSIMLLIEPETGLIINANNAADKFYGYGKSALCSMAINDINMLPSEQVLNARNNAVNEVNNHFQFEHKLKNGDIRTVEVYSTPIEYNQKRLLYSIIHDITERKIAECALQESEELFRLLADNSTDMIARLDLAGVFLYASPACRTLLGYEPEELVGSSAYSYIHPEDLKRITESHKSIVEEKISSMVVYRFRCKNGKYIWFETCSHRVFDKETGVEIEIHTSNRDVSDRVEAQKQIKFQYDSLQEHIASKDKLFSIIAHDLRGPLGSMAALSELIINSDKKFDAETQYSFIESIAKSSQNTYKLLENLLEWSRLQTGKISFVPEEGNFNEIVRESISQIQVNANVKTIQIVNNVGDNIALCFDRVMINTVLRNLISNSIKFTPQFGRISVDAKKQKNNVLVSIQDTGVGMSPEDLNKLFRITEKFTSPGTENEKGSGLGLILCKEFIEMHGGEIGVESEVGKGSVFRFTLPLNRPL